MQVVSALAQPLGAAATPRCNLLPHEVVLGYRDGAGRETAMQMGDNRPAATFIA